MIELAARVALNSTLRCRVGCVLAYRNKILNTGYNKGKTHPKQKRWGFHDGSGLHAEMDASIGIHYSDTEGATIYVARLKRDGTWGMARPCARCGKYLRHIGVVRAVYTTSQNGVIVEDL